MVLELRSLLSFIPSRVLKEPSMAFDPLPPVTVVSQYDQAYFAGVDALPLWRRQEGRVPLMDGEVEEDEEVDDDLEDDAGEVASEGEDQNAPEVLIPDPVFRQQLEVRPLCIMLEKFS
jgi:hypothetical protein